MTAARPPRRRRAGAMAIAMLVGFGPPALPPPAAAAMPAAGAQAPWRLDPAGLAPAQAQAAATLLELVFARVPAAWREGHPQVAFGFDDALPDPVHGRARGNTVRVSRQLLEDWRSAGAPREPTDPVARAAFAAVAHELAHVRDAGSGRALSRDPRLRDIAGWQRQPLRPWRTRNAFTDRSPDRYELASPAEYFAVNVEHFLLDPSFGCRRPALHRHLAGLLAHAPPAVACAAGLPFVAADAVDAVDAAADAPLDQLDPARVLSVEYLLADPDGGGAGRFGHSMLRLVVCAPGRARGPGCRLDLAHHRVLSFRAFVDDLQVSSWRGLTGAYPSRLFVLPFEHVLEDYTRVQLRGLASIPLRLDDAEVAALLARAASVHWSYDGRYAFVGNNCAVETWKLLHDGVPRLAAAPLRSITPKRLLRRLVATGIADDGVLEDDATAQRLGHRFRAADEDYARLYAVARDALALPQRDVEAWLDAPPRARARHFDAAGLQASAALLVLEHAALRRQEMHARDLLKRRLGGRGTTIDDGHGDRAEARALLTGLIGDAAVLGRPAALLAGIDGYGLPQQAERDRVAGDAAARVTSMRARDALLRGHARRLLPAAMREALDEGDANIAALRARLQRAG